MKRVVIIGPESAGKSTLCQGLAAHYNTVWCPEYAREYLLEHGMHYSYDDLTAIGRGQLWAEAETAQKAANGLYFIDTDMYVLKVWHEVVFDKCPSWVLRHIAKTSYSLYLLCNTDLPWVKDELREYPDLVMRQRLFKMYKDIAINSGQPWVEISGAEDQRLQQAIAAVDALLWPKAIS